MVINGTEYEIDVEYDKWFHTQSGMSLTGDNYLNAAKLQGVELKVVDPIVDK
jgi:hypothetical protein